MNALTPRPAYLTGGSSNLGATLAAGLTQPMPNRISLKDDRFTLVLESGQNHPQVAPSLSLQVIFVGGNPHPSRVYYASDDVYDPDNANAPVCWSDNGVGPSEKVASPVSPTCAMCPNSAWTKITAMGSKVPPCMTRKKVAVLVAGAGDTVFLLDIPPGSLKPFSQYMSKLGGELHASPEEVVTTLTMTNKQLGFETAAWLPEGMLAGVAQVVASSAPDDVVGAHDRPHQARIAAPQNDPHAQQWGDTIKLTSKPTPEQAAQWNANPPMRVFEPPVDVIPEQFTDPRFAQVAADQAAREAQPMTSQEAEAHNSGKAPRKPRSDKGQPRTSTGPIAPQTTFTKPVEPAPADPFARMYPQAPQDERNPPPQGFIRPDQMDTGNRAAQFGMAQPAPAPSDMSDMLTKAFGLRIGK